MSSPSPDAPARAADDPPRPAIVPILLTLGRALTDHGRRDEAIEALRRAIAEPEDKPDEVFAALVHAMLAAGERSEALRLAFDRLQTAPGAVMRVLPVLEPLLRPTLLRPLATEVAADYSNLAAPEEDRAREETTAQDRRRLIGFVVRAQLALQEVGRAGVLLDRAAHLVREDAGLLALLGEIRLRQRDLPTALTAFLASRETQPSAAVELRLAHVYEQLGRPRPALEHIDAAIAGGVDSEEPYALRVLVRLRLHDPDAAAQDYEEAIRRSPDSVATARAGACLHLAANDYESARAAADTGLARNPDDAGLSFLRFQSIVEAGDHSDIERRMARFAQRMDPADLAENIDRAARVRRPNDPAVHYFLGVLYQALGEPAEALQAVDTAIDLLMIERAADGEVELLELPARRLRALMLRDLLPEESGAEYERAALLAFDTGDSEAAADLMTIADGLHELTANARWTFADALQVLAYAPERRGQVDPDRLAQALDVWDKAYRRELPTLDYAWAYISRARMSMMQARIEPEKQARVLEAVVWLQCYDTLFAGTEAYFETFGTACAQLGIYGVRAELTFAAARPPLTDRFIPDANALSTAAANSGDLAMLAAVDAGDMESLARLELLRGNPRAALGALDETGDDQRYAPYHLWLRALAEWETGNLPAVDRTLSATPVPEPWEGISVWLHLLGGDPHRALQLVEGLDDERSWSTDAEFERALCRLALEAPSAPEAEETVLEYARHCRSYEDVHNLVSLAGILGSRYPATAEAFRRIGDAAAARIDAEFWPLTSEADTAYLESLGTDWAEIAANALRARVALSRADWAAATTAFTALIPHLDRFPEVESGLAWITTELRGTTPADELLDQVGTAVAQVIAASSRRAGLFVPELDLGDLHLLAGRADRARALYQAQLTRPIDEEQRGSILARLHLLAVEAGHPDAEDLLQQALETFRPVGNLPFAAVCNSVNHLVRTAPEWLRLLSAWEPGAGVVEGERYQLHLSGRYAYALMLKNGDRAAEAEPILRDVLADEGRIYGPEAPDTLVTAHVLAGTVAGLGRWTEAEELFREVVAARTRVLGPSDPATLSSGHELGWVLSNDGRQAAAEEVYRDVLAGKLAALGPDDASTLVTWHNLAGVLTSQERWQEALDEYQQVLAARERVFGPDDPVTTSSRFEVAWVLYKLGRFAESEAEYQRVIDHRSVLFGPDDPVTLSARYELGELLRASGDATRALEEFQAVAEARRRTLGEDDTGTINARYEVASLLYETGEYAEAEQIYRDVLALERANLGPDDPTTLVTWHNFAGAIARQGRWAEAEQEFQGVAEARTRTLGVEHAHTLATRHELARLRTELGDIATAEAAYREILAAKRRLLGDDDPSTLVTWDNLAMLLSQTGRYAEAEEQFRELLPIHIRSRGADHERTLSCRDEWAWALYKLERFDEATEQYRIVIDRRTALVGATHPSTVSARTAYAVIRRDSGDIPAAEAELRSVVSSLTSAYGPNGPEIVAARSTLAWLLVTSGSVSSSAAEGLALLAASVDGLLTERRPADPEVVAARIDLADALVEVGQIDDAVAQYEAALAAQRAAFGDDDPAVLTTWAAYANLLTEADRWTQALPELDGIADAYARTLGPTADATLVARRKAGWAHYQCEDYAGAAAAYRSLADDESTVLGERHPATLASRLNAAVLRGRAGDRDGAIDELRDLLVFRDEALGAEDPETRYAREEFATMLTDAGRHADAVAERRILLAAEISALGPTNSETLDSRRTLAALYRALGDLDSALAELTVLADVSAELAGPNAPNTLAARYNVAECLAAAGRYAEAEAGFREVLAGEQEAIGLDDPSYYITLGSLASVYIELDRWEEAEEAYRTVVDNRARLLGEDHPATLGARFQLGGCLAALDRYAESETEIRGVLATQRETLGDDDPGVYVTWEALGDLLLMQNRVTEAAEAYRVVLAARTRLLGPDAPDTVRIRDELADLA
ncbi:MAG: tetratricopeptide repeat protein [Hamadaea sp.]|uniref:tetratricopeptide repeat protein n=1 Tax=Hamadaea sp. TaxID=2024425 RepID=UPI0017A60A36|nr:tetratricopeptide repeat protein [Hamadaea sp.]NUR69724.1 tetratricopeptide repeat protein [Hamadaea sp.]NUT23487.1 tetratricopeptide repeat protein [Hamadaea sp.]